MMGVNQDLFLNQVSIQIYEIYLFKYFSKIFRAIFYVFCWFIKNVLIKMVIDSYVVYKKELVNKNHEKCIQV